MYALAARNIPTPYSAVFAVRYPNHEQEGEQTDPRRRKPDVGLTERLHRIHAVAVGAPVVVMCDCVAHPVRRHESNRTHAGTLTELS